MIKLQPSGAHRWIPCTASAHLIAKLVKQGKIDPTVSSEFAEEGKLAHEWAACILEDTKWDKPQIDDDMRAYMFGYGCFVTDTLDFYGGETKAELYVEYKAPLFYPYDSVGIVDAAVISNDGTAITVIDLKYGRGVDVSPENNPQLLIYARSLVEDLEDYYDFTVNTIVNMVIYQPRTPGRTVKSWTLNLARLLDETNRIDVIAKSILNEESIKFSPSEDACRFCPASPYCKARTDYLLKGLWEEDDRVPFELLDKGTVVNILEREKQIVSYLKHIKQRAYEDVLSGEKYSGFKLVKSRSNRRWRDEQDAYNILSDDFSDELIIKQKLISPTQAEKLYKRTEGKAPKKITGEIFKPEGAPTLVPETDRRKEIKTAVDVEEEFDNLND